MEKRIGTITRETRETRVSVEISLDEIKTPQIDTSVPFMDHMLELFSYHGRFYLNIKAEGDTEIDDHHTIEDIGICLGEAIRKALSSCKGIVRYGDSSLPMDEALARISIDISNRPFLLYNVPIRQVKLKAFDTFLVKEFFHALVNNARITLHIEVPYGENQHHIFEAIFKGFGVAFSKATRRIENLGTPSTKGIL